MQSQPGILKTHKNWPQTMKKKNLDTWKTIKTHLEPLETYLEPWNRPETMKNYKNLLGTIKNSPGTMKSHTNPPGTIKNQPGTFKTHKKLTWNHEKILEP